MCSGGGGGMELRVTVWGRAWSGKVDGAFGGYGEPWGHTSI